MSPLRAIATGVSAFLVLLFVTAPTYAQNMARCSDIFGGAFAVSEVKRDSSGASVHMSPNLELPSYSLQEMLGGDVSDSQKMPQTSTLIISRKSSVVSGTSSFPPPTSRSFIEGKANLTWNKYVDLPSGQLLSRLTVSHRLLHNGIEVEGFIYEDDTNQVLPLRLHEIRPVILCKVSEGGPYIVEGGVSFEIELRKLAGSGEHNVSVEVAVGIR